MGRAGKRGMSSAALRALAGAAGVVMMLGMGMSGGGCQLIAGMAASADREGSHEVQVQYDGLAGHSYAVVVAADRVIQADHPDVVVLLTREIARLISEHVDASGWVPPDRVLEYQYRNPGWVAKSPQELAEAFGVERLIFVDLREFAIHDPGNPHVWNGVAAGLVGVVEADDQRGSWGGYAYTENIRVSFPDIEGLGPEQIPADTVRLALSKRFVDRVTWLFYTHEEPNAIEY